MNTTLQMVSPTERLVYLRSLAIGVDLPLSDLRIIAEYAVERTFAAGSTIFDPSMPVVAVWAMTQGRVQLTRGDSLEVVEAPEWLGLLPALGDVSGTTAIALEPVVALEVGADVVLEVVHSNFGLIEAFVERLAGLAISFGGVLPKPGQPASADPHSSRPLDLVDRIEALQSIGILERVNLASLIPLAESMQLVELEPGEVLWEIGDAAQCGIAVVHGTVFCSFDSGEVGSVGSGTGLGFFHALCHHPRSYSAVATSKVVGFRIDINDLMALAEYRRSLGMDILASLSRVLGERTERALRGRTTTNT